MAFKFPKLPGRIRIPGNDISLRSALNEIEFDRLERTSGTSIFAWPVLAYQSFTRFFTESSWQFLISLLLGLLLLMYLIDGLPSLFNLRWTQKPILCSLPDGVSRTMIRGSEGKLEVLISDPPTTTTTTTTRSSPRKPAILLLHGGFGSASIWLPWLSSLHQTYAGSVYALSLRGHGASFTPGFVEMTYLTSMTTLSSDVAAALLFIARREESAGSSTAGLIIAAHSGGGGLTQHALASGKVPVKALAPIGGLKGLALIASIPPSGAMGVYFNWFLADPVCFLRYYLHFQHPRSALASTRLVKGAFFSDAFPELEVREFEKRMPGYESLIWPSQMLFGQFVDVDEILATMEVKNVLIMASDKDRLMGVKGQRNMAREYANVLKAEDMEGEFTNKHDVRIEAEGTVAGKKHEDGMVGSLQLNLIKGSGHQLMNDVKREEAAEVFRKWAEGV